MPHDHDHHHHDHASASFGTAFAVGAVLNVGFVAVEVFWGLAAHSMALLADAVHNSGDVLGLLLAWGAAWLAGRRPSQRRTYGWGRFSIIAANINAIVLLIGIGAIAVEALRRFAEPAPVASAIVVWVAAGGVVVNGFTAWMFSHGHEDLNIRATFLHMAGDAAVSLGVVVAALLLGLTGWLWLDPAASLLIAAMILLGTWGLLRDAANLAIDGVPAGIEHAAVADYLRTLPGVIEVHDLHIWGLSTTETALTAHLVQRAGAGTEAGEALILRATTELGHRFRIGHATLQLESEALANNCQLRPAHVI